MIFPFTSSNGLDAEAVKIESSFRCGRVRKCGVQLFVPYRNRETICPLWHAIQNELAKLVIRVIILFFISFLD